MIVNPGIRRFSGIKPALNLVFTGGESISSMITFSRASGGTRVNSAGLIETVPVNLLTYSNDWSNGAWAKVGTASVTGTNVINTPVNSDYVSNAVTLAITPGMVFCCQVLLSGSGICNIRLNRSGAGTLEGTTSAAITLTATPTLYTVSHTFANVQTALRFDIGLFGSGTATQITAANAQLQTGSVATTYIPTTTAASGAPRFDYDPVTLAPRGLLIEESRANILTYSNDLSSATAAWTPTLGTAVISGTAPDGTATATLFTPSAGTAQHYVSRAATGILTATAYSFSVFAKSNGKTFFSIYCASMPSTGAAWFTLTGAGTVSNLTAGVTGTIQAFPNGWYRCTYTGTTSSTGTAIELHTGSTLGNFSDVANGTDGVYLWGAQFETASASGAAPFSTSLIPTTTAAVTRAADVASMTGTNFSSWFNQSEGTFSSKVDCMGFVAGAGGNRTLSCSGGAVLEQTLGSSGQRQYKINATFPVANAIAMTVGVPYVSCVAWSGTTYSVTSGGIPPATGSAVPSGNTAFHIGNSAGVGAFLNGHLQRISFYPRRLPDATLRSLSA